MHVVHTLCVHSAVNAGGVTMTQTLWVTCTPHRSWIECQRICLDVFDVNEFEFTPCL